ncbi:glycosyltransferase family 4 protein [Pontibacter kalidii]|uniref:glycosyltransferase family 4 protein n=1 Tax=Pontibacter kalidii TaxID=2592049 RepID=UPI00224F8EA7|nr:glycosyltransferase family 4 protein [Pontibacter kalidii]
MNRLLQLFTIWKYDIVVIEKELFPYLPATVERILSFLGVKYIVDYDDAIFHNYDMHPNKYVRAALGNKIAQVMKYATLVVTGNEYLKAYAVRAGAKEVSFIPTVIDTSKYRIKSKANANENITIGWIGSPSTLQYLNLIKSVLEELSALYSFELAIVGGKSGIGLQGIEKVLEWSEDKEIEMIQDFDIGVMPLKDELWELGKCGYKLIQYMGCGVPVIGSPVGANNDIIQEGKNGFKPTNLEEWKQAFQELLENKELRRLMGANGRRIVEEKYSLQITQTQWLHKIQAASTSQQK